MNLKSLFPQNRTKLTKILDRIATAIIALILILVILISGSIVYKSTASPREDPTIFGYTTMVILSDSMMPSIKSGDLVFLK